MMSNVIPALLLGLSVDGIVLCPFFAFGVTLTDRRAGLSFLCGRLAGIAGFGIAVNLLGSAIHVDRRIVNLVFGLVVVGLGIHRLLGALIRSEATHQLDFSENDRSQGACKRHGKAGQKVGFGLGIFRGLLNPGRKYVYLPPLLVGVSLLEGAIVSLAFGLASSIYLAVALLSAGLVGKLVPHRRLLSIVGGIALVGLGGLYVWKARGIGF